MKGTDRDSGVAIVTGSSGFIGRPLVRRLARSFSMVGFDREGWPNPPKEAECVCIGLTSDESVHAAFERVRYAYGGHIASVLHLAAYYDFSGEPSPLYDEITVRGTGRLLRALQAFNVDQFVFSSTRRGSIHQGLDGRYRGRPLCARHQPSATDFGLAAEAVVTRDASADGVGTQGRSDPVLQGERAGGAVMAGAERHSGAVSRPAGERDSHGHAPTHADTGGSYVCPMHPDVRQDNPGTCPKCGMKLVPDRSNQSHADHAQDHEAMLRDMRAPWLWTNASVILLGLWLISSPWTFGYRSVAMTWSDVASGVLLVGLAAAAFIPRYDFYGRWGIALVGTWLQFAPLVFWAQTPAAYITDTLVGALAITLSILVPMMPGMAHHMAMMQPGPEIPPGWTYNPSTWHQRAPMIGLGFIRWLLSRYLAAFQLGYIDRIGEPFFGDGTVRVLTSEMSKNVADLRCRTRRHRLYVRDADGVDGRQDALAHDAVDGDLLLHPGRSARADTHRPRDQPARCGRPLVHHLSGRRSRDAGDDPIHD